MPIIRPQTGLKNGLSVILDMKPGEKDVPSSISYDFNGVEVNLGAKQTFPMLATNTFLISPGKVTMVEIIAEKRSTSHDFEKLPVNDRGCYFEYERPLQLFLNYTSDNCWIECLINLTHMENNNNCTPWNMPSPDGHRCCNPLEQQDFFDTFDQLDMSKVLGAELCYPDCESTVYSTKVTTAPFRNCDQSNMGLSRLCTIGRQSNGPVPQKWADDVLRAYLNYSDGNIPNYISDTVRSAYREKGDTPWDVKYNAYEEDMAEVKFFFTRPVTTEFLSSPRIRTFDILSSMGGIMGLFMGFSILSGIEIIYWFTIGLAENALKKKPVRN